MPHLEPESALDLIFEATPKAPNWPQLPNVSPYEAMLIQFSEGMPCAHVSEDQGSLSFDTDRDATVELERFYETFLEAGPGTVLEITDKYGRGIRPFMERLQRMDEADRPPVVKGQVVGPVTLGLSAVDEQGTPIFYNALFSDVVVKGLAMKAQWQIEAFAGLGGHVAIFIDEPILAAYGSSAYLSVSRDDVVTRITEVVEAIHQAGGVAGCHCCGNTEWSILTDSGIDILSFDAYAHLEGLALYPDAISALLERGGALAWGIVPTNETVLAEDTGTLQARIDKGLGLLEAKGVDGGLLRERFILTPSCGTGSVDVHLSEAIFERLRDVASKMGI